MSLDWLGDVLQKDADDRDRHKRWYSLSDEQKDTIENLLASGILDLYINPNWVNPLLENIIYPKVKNNIPEACKHCSNHPSNGGSGVCLCTLGLPKITC